MKVPGIDLPLPVEDPVAEGIVVPVEGEVVATEDKEEKSE